MSAAENSILQCPVCRKVLLRSTGGYQCVNKHSFDAARQGYVNFLLSHKKHSKEPGDNREMIESRRRFLGRGFYNRFSDGLNEALAGDLDRLERGRTCTVLDAGCGEGFYLQRFKESLTHKPGAQRPIDYYGVDISKIGVRQATQRDKTMNWFVASIIDLPFADGSLDIILNVFSLADFAEFSRILKASGTLVLAGPGPRHLNGLRKIIYPAAREHAESTRAEQARGLFALAGEKRVQYQLDLKSNQEIMDLLAMTPYFWNIDLDTKAKVEALGRLALDVDVLISVFKKVP